jgi:uncharacterized protein (UPF0332 family)
MSLDKVRSLLNQAEEDLKIACYDKCISSSYFSCRMMVEIFLRSRKVEHLPRRDDKLANLLRNQGLKEEADTLLFLYDMRKKADYGWSIAGRKDAERSLREAKSLISSISERMGLKLI